MAEGDVGPLPALRAGELASPAPAHQLLTASELLSLLQKLLGSLHLLLCVSGCSQLESALSLFLSLLVQGLLIKQPNSRLDWPELLNHPFVRLTPAEVAALDAKQSTLTQRPGMKRADSSPPPGLASRSPAAGETSWQLTRWQVSCVHAAGTASATEQH